MKYFTVVKPTTKHWYHNLEISSARQIFPALQTVQINSNSSTSETGQNPTCPSQEKPSEFQYKYKNIT